MQRAPAALFWRLDTSKRLRTQTIEQLSFGASPPSAIEVWAKHISRMYLVRRDTQFVLGIRLAEDSSRTNIVEFSIWSGLPLSTIHVAAL
jgi:hypothetical protein